MSNNRESNVAALLRPDPDGISAAVAILRAGGLVAFPTETVYGLGADARRGDAVLSVYAAKDRPRGNPLIIHVADLQAAMEIGEFNSQAEQLARAFWPGPLTLVLPHRTDSGVTREAVAGLPTVAIRVPAHRAAQMLLTALHGPMAGPSANPSGRVSPTKAVHVLADLGSRIKAVVDGGACAVGLESTIVGFGADGPMLLREGGVVRSEIEDILQVSLQELPPSRRPVAPGSFDRHYAPASHLRINAESPEPGECWLGFGPEPDGIRHAVAARNLSLAGNTAEAAQSLYACIRELDVVLGGRGRISVRTIPDNGFGAAVNDRLRRAAAPRS